MRLADYARLAITPPADAASRYAGITPRYAVDAPAITLSKSDADAAAGLTYCYATPITLRHDSH